MFPLNIMTEILKEEPYLDEETGEVEVIEAPTTNDEPKQSGRKQRSEAQLKALERGRQRAAEKREALRKAKEVPPAPEPEPEPMKKEEPVKKVRKPRTPKPKSEPTPVPVPEPPPPPKPTLERRDGRFFLNL